MGIMFAPNRLSEICFGRWFVKIRCAAPLYRFLLCSSVAHLLDSGHLRAFRADFSALQFRPLIREQCASRAHPGCSPLGFQFRCPPFESY